MTPRPAALALLVPLLLLVPGACRPAATRAGTAVRMDVTELVSGAGLVLTGRVVATRAVVAPSGRVDTEYTLEVERTFWGPHQAQRVVRLPGGVLPDGSGMLLAGMPRLATGDEALLTLSEAGPDGMRLPVGLSQGCFHLLEGSGGRRLAVRAAGGASLAAAGAHVTEGGRYLVEYGELVAEVVRAVEERRARGEEVDR